MNNLTRTIVEQFEDYCRFEDIEDEDREESIIKFADDILSSCAFGSVIKAELVEFLIHHYATQ